MNQEKKDILIQVAKDFDICAWWVREALENPIIEKMIDEFTTTTKPTPALSYKVVSLISDRQHTDPEYGLYACPMCWLKHRKIDNLMFHYSTWDDIITGIWCEICMFLKWCKDENVEPLQDAMYIYSDESVEYHITDVLEEAEEECDDEVVAIQTSNLEYYHKIQEMFWLTLKFNEKKIFKPLEDMILTRTTPKNGE